MDGAASQENAINRDIRHEIILAVSSIRHGSVEVIIHDSRVVQIEIKEKVRFDTDGSRKDRIRGE